MVACRQNIFETKHNGRVHRHGTPIFGDIFEYIVAYVCEPINNDNQIFWRL